MKGWDEKPLSEIAGGPKLGHARVTKSTHGHIEGEGTFEYLTVYHADGSAGVFGMQRMVGNSGRPVG